MSINFLSMVLQVTHNISFSSKFLEFPTEIHQIPIGSGDVISLAVSDVHPPTKPIYLFLGLFYLVSYVAFVH